MPTQQLNEDAPFVPIGEAVATLKKPFSDYFTSTPEEAAEHEAWIKSKQAEKKEHAMDLARMDWELAVPPELRVTNFQDARLTPYAAQISTILKWKMGKRGIYAVGQSGRGKSRAMYALARRLAVTDLVNVRYLLQNEITRDINRNGMTGFLEKMDQVKRASVILWDDFGKFAAMGSRKDVLFAEIEALVDYRFSHGLPFLISANAKDGDLIQLFGELRGKPIIRRLLEGCEVVNFGWEET